MYRTRLQKREFASITELARYLEMSAKRKKNFEKAVGYDAGLSYEVAQCRMAMEYPPHGLPVLLTGPARDWKKHVGQAVLGIRGGPGAGGAGSGRILCF